MTPEINFNFCEKIFKVRKIKGERTNTEKWQVTLGKQVGVKENFSAPPTRIKLKVKPVS